MEERHCGIEGRGAVHGSIGSSDAKPETRALNQRARERPPPCHTRGNALGRLRWLRAPARNASKAFFSLARSPPSSSHQCSREGLAGRSVDGATVVRTERGQYALSHTHSVLRSRRVTRRPTVAGWQMAPGDDRDGGGGGQYGHATVIK